MLKTRLALRTLVALAALIVGSATYASADTLTLVNGPIDLITPGDPPPHAHTLVSVQFSNASVVAEDANQLLRIESDIDGLVGFATVDVNGTALLDDDVRYSLFLAPGEFDDLVHNFLFRPSSPTGIFKQDTDANQTILFTTDHVGLNNPFIQVAVTNSWLDLRDSLQQKWFIAGETSGGGDVCEGECPATWKFIDGDADLNVLDKNSEQMELDFHPVGVPEPSSLYLLAIGLGLGTQLIRKRR